jgi:TonB family protein
MTSIALLASYLLNAIWQVALIIATGCLAARLLRRFNPSAEHIVCVFTLFVAILLPATPFLHAVFSPMFRSPAAGAYLSLAQVANPVDGTEVGRAVTLSIAKVRFFAFLYVASLCYFTVKLIWSLRCTSKLLQTASPLSFSSAQDQVLSECLQAFSLKAPRILSSRGVSGPVVLGLRSPILLVPPDFATRCALPEFLAALAHEFAHIKRRDFQKNLFYEVMSLVVAFHPAVWIIKAQIAQSREMTCDRMVTEKVVDPGAYARSLLWLASMVATRSRAASAHPIGIFDGNVLEKRIMIVNSKKHRVNSLVNYGLTVLATLFILAVSVTMSNAAVFIETSQPSVQTQNVNEGAYGRVYKVGKDVSSPVPLKMVEASFPKSAKDIKSPFEAFVVVKIIVDADGMPQEPKIVRSYNPDFDAEALKAVRKYRFSPGKREGKPVAVALNIEINFKLF